MTKVFGIGWARTGTTTLGTCFRLLGYNHQTQDLSLVKDLAKNDLLRIMALAATKDTFDDWPWIILYQQLDQAFPGSKFVLTRRKTENWLRSYENMRATEQKTSADINEIRRILYGLPFPHVTQEQLIERYERHNAEVVNYFRDRPGDLLVVDWEQGDGWNELCAFLGRSVPDQPFPHANKGYYPAGRFSRLLRAVRAHLG